MNVLLISEKTLKTDSLINDNVDSMYILPAVQMAQEQGLQSIIGTKLYNRICNDVKDGHLEDDYKLLLDDYITPYLEYQVMSDIQIPLAYKMRNLGVIQTTDEHTLTPSMKDIQYLVEYYGNKAKFYSNRLYDFLCANCNTYKEFRKKDNCSDLMSNKQSYKTHISLV